MAELKVGVGRRVITPPMGNMLQGYTPARPALSVYDDVNITAFAFQTGEVKSLLFSAEVCNIRLDVIRMIKTALEEATGVPGGNMIIACTHTHSGPHMAEGVEENPQDNFVVNVFIPRAVEAALEALAHLRPAQMGVGTTWSDVAVNRREIKEDTGTVKLGQNPYGSWDPTMTVVAFREPDGTPIGNIIHYGCHNTASGKNSEISRDWAGVMVDRLEAQSGAVTAFINGCGGDCGPRLPNGKTTGDLQMALELGGKAGIDAVRAYNNIQLWEPAPMQIHSLPIRMPLRNIGTVEQVRAEIAALGDPDLLKGISKGTYNLLVERAEYLEAGNVPPTEEIIHNSFLVLGNLVLQGIPFEPFSLITLRVKAGSPFRHTLCVGYTNGSRSYFPSMDQIPRGGYEVNMFRTRNIVPFADDAEQSFVTDSLTHLRRLYENR